jgi:transcriptional regulator with XRE-family HTH domain
MTSPKTIGFATSSDVRRYIDMPSKKEGLLAGPLGPLGDLLEGLTPKERAKLIGETADNLARDIAADIVHSELAKYGKGLREIEEESGLQPAVISRIATGYNKRGPGLSTLFKIALAMGKTVNITFEDPIVDDD